jgi:hypothetical protein
MSHVGIGSERPAEPNVKESQLIATSWTRNSSAIVRITNDGPRVRIAIAPITSAKRPATTPPSGTHTNGLPPTRTDRSPTV